jgi:hypothetical protein
MNPAVSDGLQLRAVDADVLERAAVEHVELPERLSARLPTVQGRNHAPRHTDQGAADRGNRARAGNQRNASGSHWTSPCSQLLLLDEVHIGGASQSRVTDIVKEASMSRQSW